MSSGMTHWGTLIAKVLKAWQVDTYFTLSGGHLFPMYDGTEAEGIRIIDVRHEASAGFAAEAWGRLTRRIGVAAVTAGPGVFNSINPLASAQKNQSPTLLIGGRAPESRWGMGSLQEIDHVPVAEPLAKIASTAGANALTQLSEAIAAAMTAPRGGIFMDFPLDLIATGEGQEVPVRPSERIEPDPAMLDELGKLVGSSSRPALIAGSNVYMDGAWEAMRAFVERAGIPVFTNGSGRGTLPADHELAFVRARSKATKECDLIIVAGTPMDFRLGFGDGFPAEASVVHLDSHPSLITSNRQLAVGLGADLDLVFRALADRSETSASSDWIRSLREKEEAERASVAEELVSSASPIHPMRIYGEINRFLDRDAIVIGDGGDFVSYAGKEVPSYVPGAWLDPGPFGCLGCGPGYAIAAKALHPDRQVMLLLGDGAFGFSGMEFDTMVRHNLPVVAVVGNNGIWALEKHPMRMFFGYDVAADLRQETRYDKIVEAMGGYGELVTDPDEIGPALKRAADSGVPACINVLTDPEVVYPRSANLA